MKLLDKKGRADNHDKALKIIEQAEKDRLYEFDCVKAMLCPNCGGSLLEHSSTTTGDCDIKYSVQCRFCGFEKVTSTL